MSYLLYNKSYAGLKKKVISIGYCPLLTKHVFPVVLQLLKMFLQHLHCQKISRTTSEVTSWLTPLSRLWRTDMDSCLWTTQEETKQHR